MNFNKEVFTQIKKGQPIIDKLPSSKISYSQIKKHMLPLLKYSGRLFLYFQN